MPAESNPTILLKAVAYIRVSSDEQAKGMSLDDQQRTIREYADKVGISIVLEWVEVGSASKPGRLKFGELIQFLIEEKKKPDGCTTVLAVTTDRMSRNSQDSYILESLQPTIHFVMEQKIIGPNSTPHEGFAHDIDTAVSKFNTALAGQKVSSAMREKARQGHWPSCPPIGYRSQPKAGPVLNPNEAPYIRRMFEDFATGRYTLSEIAERANAAGMRTRRQRKPLRRGDVSRIFKNGLYAGTFEWSGEAYSSVDPIIVSRELFDHVRALLDEKGRHHARPKKYTWFFRGMLRCGHCNGMLSAERQKKHIYYRCTTKPKCLDSHYAREERVAEQFGDALERIRLDADVLTWLVDTIKADSLTARSDREVRLREQRRRQQSAQLRIDRLTDLYTDQDIERQDYRRRVSAYRAEQDDIARTIESIQSDDRSYVDDSVRVLELAHEARALYDRQDMKSQAELARIVFSNSVWIDGALVPEYRKPFDILAITNEEWRREKAEKGDEASIKEKWRAVADDARLLRMAA